VKKSVELTDVSTVVKTAKNLRWLQIATPFALSLVVGAMAGAMLGGMFYGNSIDPASGDFKFVVAQVTGIVLGLVVGYLWSRQVAMSGPPEEVVTVGMSMLRKYHRNHAKTGLDAEAAQYKLSADYLKTLKSVK
jgi:F0F1-type ATP synthase assembly protein I